MSNVPNQGAVPFDPQLPPQTPTGPRNQSQGNTKGGQVLENVAMRQVHNAGVKKSRGCRGSGKRHTHVTKDPYEAERIAMALESQAIADEDAAINDERNAIQQLTQTNPQDPTLFHRKAYLKARQNALGARGAQLGLRRKSWKSGAILELSSTKPSEMPAPQNQQMYSAPPVHYDMSMGTPQVQMTLQQLNLSGNPAPKTRFQPLDAYGTLLKTPNDLAAWQQSHYPVSQALQGQAPAPEPKKITLAQIKQQQNNISGRAVQSQKIGRPLQPVYYQSAVPAPVPSSVQAIEEDRIDKHFSSGFQGFASKYLVRDYSVLLTDEKKQARDTRREVLDAIIHTPLGPVLLGEGSEEEENPVTQSAEAGQSDSMMGGL